MRERERERQRQRRHSCGTLALSVRWLRLLKYIVAAFIAASATSHCPSANSLLEFEFDFENAAGCLIRCPARMRFKILWHPPSTEKQRERGRRRRRESDLINFHATHGQILCGPYRTRLIAAAANRTGNFIRPQQLKGERAHGQTGSTRRRQRKVKSSGRSQRKVSKGEEEETERALYR